MWLGAIIGLIVGGFLMFMLINGENAWTERKEQNLLDDLDDLLQSYSDITVMYDEYNKQEQEQAYVFYSCLVSRVMWKNAKIVEAAAAYVKFNNGITIHFSNDTTSQAFFCKKNSIMRDFVPNNKEYWEF